MVKTAAYPQQLGFAPVAVQLAKRSPGSPGLLEMNVVQPSVERTPMQQFVVPPNVDNPAGLHDNDTIGKGEGRQPMGHHDCSTVSDKRL